MLNLVTPPVVEPVTVAEAKGLLGLPANVPDATVSMALIAARQAMDGKHGWLGRAIVTQTWDLVLDAPPDRAINLPLPSVQEIVAVSTYEDGVWTDADPASYRLSKGSPDKVTPTGSWPRGSGPQSFRIRYKTGFGDIPADVPQPIRQAILLHARSILSTASIDPALQYERVEGVGEMRWGFTESTTKALSDTVKALAGTYRVPWYDP